MRKTTALLVFCAIMIWGCEGCGCGGIKPIPTVIDAGPAPVVDASPIPTPVVDAAPAPEPIKADPAGVCATWVKLGCDGAQGTGKGVPCVTVVTNSAKNPIYSARFPCIIKAKSCAESNGCGTFR